ncbi:UNVERIFIED_CONTAM: hypothetical protein FKN15_071073 [Acipenser sinensis]
MAKFALVSWIENGEGGRIYTINTNWIQDFNLSNFTKVYLTEWREPGKKKPDEGWPLYKAKIPHASDATKRKFPGTKRGDIGKTINGKINKLCYQLKKDTKPATENNVNSV